jgi:hypothetical protein
LHCLWLLSLSVAYAIAVHMCQYFFTSLHETRVEPCKCNPWVLPLLARWAEGALHAAQQLCHSPGCALLIWQVMAKEIPHNLHDNNFTQQLKQCCWGQLFLPCPIKRSAAHDSFHTCWQQCMPVWEGTNPMQHKRMIAAAWPGMVCKGLNRYR